jgi:phosphoglycolate phosphatase
MIGDHANDIAAARGAGVRSVYAEWGYGQPAYAQGATACAAAIRDVPALLDALLPDTGAPAV